MKDQELKEFVEGIPEDPILRGVFTSAIMEVLTERLKKGDTELIKEVIGKFLDNGVVREHLKKLG